MKRILYILLLSSICFSCKDFLNLTPKNKVVVYTQEDVKAEMAAYLYTMSCYNGYKIYFADEKIFFPMDVFAYTSLCMYSDDIEMTQFLTSFVKECGYTDDYMENINWEGVSWSETYWFNSYMNIGFLNTILKDSKNAPDKDPEWTERIEGEARVFRAYYAFKLLQFFAPYKNNELGIPLNTDADQVEGGRRWTQTEVYDFIISELTTVLDYKTLPVSGWSVMYNKEIIRSILAQVYWFKAMSAAADEKDWENAEKYSAAVLEDRDVIRDLKSYNDIFEPTVGGAYVQNNPHALLMFAYDRSADFGEGIWGDIYYGSEEVQYPDKDFMKMFDPEDIRKQAFFDLYEEDDVQYRFISKYHYSNYRTDVMILFRTDDIYLINAEAKARQGNLAGAKKSLVDFKAAKIPGYTSFSGNSLEEVLNEILNERRKEFCYENDYRWLDMKRLNLAITRKGLDIDSQVKEYSISAGDYRYALPIPFSSELQFNRIPQNPGWVIVK